MSKPINFNAGPAVLPTAVLTRARDEFEDFAGTGISILETSHRSPEFVQFAETAESNLRKLLRIPDDYAVLFVQGGATSQFSAVPLNLSKAGDNVGYVVTGSWSKKAAAEAARYARVEVVASSETEAFSHIPPIDTWRIPDQAAYVHYTPNETIGGVEFHWIPAVGDIPLVADMSSTILSRPVDVSQFGVVYAGAQKNIGPAGLTLVIVRRDLLDRVREQTPSLMQYRVADKTGSMSNTPPVFAWYMAGLVFEWLLDNGGLPAQAERNQVKAQLLYDAIENSDGFYRNPVAAECRSWMNVPFTLARDELTPIFLQQSSAANLLGLKGHRSVGGMRASIYNAMDYDGVAALVEFMSQFRREHDSAS